jgi:hypothetical protein
MLNSECFGSRSTVRKLRRTKVKHGMIARYEVLQSLLKKNDDFTKKNGVH